MKRKLYGILTLILFGGAVFAYTTLYYDFLRFENIYGTVFRVQDCSIPNPITTPCFWGALFFLIGFFISLSIFNRSKKSKDSGKLEKYLYFLLFGGTIFAWSNFTFELYKFYFTSGPKTSCSGILTSTPFTTPCFYGAMIYLLGFVTMLVIRKNQRKNEA